MSDVPTDPTLDVLAAARLKHSVRRSAVAVATAQVASQIVSLAGLAVLLRLLAPADYGLVGMILPLVMFLRIFTTLGLNVATVQQPQLRPEETSALFWLNLLLGCGTAVVMAIVAPGLGWLYAQPDSATALRDVALALSATSIVAALGAQHQALLERSLRLGALSVIRIVAQLAAVIAAIVTALAGGGVWALVVQQYVELAFISGLVWWAEGWRPVWPARAAIAGHLRLGGYFAAASIVFYVADNLDRVLVGRLIGPDAVGLYGQAYNVMIKPVYVVVTPLIPLVLASLSRAAEQPETRCELVVAYYRLLAVLLLPASAGLVVVGSDVMQLLGGPRWTAAGPLLSVLSFGMFGQALVILGAPVLTAAGRTGRLLAAAILVAIGLSSAYLMGWWWGEQRGQPVLGIALGYAVAILAVIAVPFTRYALRTAHYPALEVFQAMSRPALYAVAMAGIVSAASRGLTLQGVTSPLMRLALLIPLGALTYGVLARQEIAWFIRQVQQLSRDAAQSAAA